LKWEADPSGWPATIALSLLAMAYAIGPISGCHINPAVTLGLLVSRKIEVDEAVRYWVAQVLSGGPDEYRNPRVFIVAPLVGALIGAGVHMALFSESSRIDPEESAVASEGRAKAVA
jgi:glycerol uptake facilitator-like aquaporin